MPVATTDVLAELDRLLTPTRFQDYCSNGLQVPGPDQIDKIATGVSAHAELFELAADNNANLLLVHHGLFWGSGTTAIDPQLKRRLQLLFDANIALAAYHLPLDAHPQLGNNALIARSLGVSGELTPFALHQGEPIGFIASLPGRDDETEGSSSSSSSSSKNSGLPATDLFERIQTLTARTPLIYDAGPAQIHRLAIVSGGGADYLADAAAAGAQAFLTGEVPERAMAEAREHGIHLIAAGHYATETFGVKALGEHLAERFGLSHTFLDVPNPV